MSSDEKRGLRPVDAPEEPIETTSGIARKAAETVSGRIEVAVGDGLKQATGALIEQVRAGRVTAWALVAALAVLTAGAVAYWALSRPSDCNPLVVQHVLHQSRVGEEAAAHLDANGEHAAAEAIRILTDVDGQPDDVRLCVLIQQKASR